MKDLISRQAAIDALAKEMPSLTTPDGTGQFDHDIQIADEAFVDAMQILNDLPSTQPVDKDINVPCTDVIDRQAAINALENTECELLPEEWDELTDAIINLPAAQPLTDEDYIELHDRFGTWIEEVVRDMISGEGKRWGQGWKT